MAPTPIFCVKRRIARTSFFAPKIFLGMLVLTLLIGIGGSQASATPNAGITVSPVSGPVGTEISITGRGFPLDSEFDLLWSTVEGRWAVPEPTREPEGSAEHEHRSEAPIPGETLIFHGHDFLGSEFSVKEYVIASVKSDGSGSFDMRIKVPYDFGGRHYITVIEKGGNTELAKAIFTLLPSFSISPTEGPPGTAIIIRAHGLGWGLYSTNYHVLWDNKYVGYATAVTTGGNATFTIYAVGDPGKHYIDIYEGYPGPAYLNIQEAPPNPQYYSPPLIPLHAEFTITPPAGAAIYNTAEAFTIGSLGLILAGLVIAPFTYRRDGREKSGRWVIPILLIVVAMALAGLALFSAGGAGVAEVQTKAVEVRPEIVLPYETTRDTSSSGLPALSVNPRVTTVGSDVTISGSDFPSGAKVDLLWATKKGSYLRGWNDVVQPLGTVTADSEGSFTFSMRVPHDLEGPHEIGAEVDGTGANVVNASLYVTRSASITPVKGPSGTTVEIRMTGVGWTFVTNTATIVYDNSFVGYSCGFNSLGNVTVYIKAVGKPGIHTIDIYPSIYDGPPQGKANSIYRYPLLTPEDHPARSPAFHFEFVITESDHQSETSSGIFSTQNISIATMGVGVVSLALQTSTRIRAVHRGRA